MGNHWANDRRGTGPTVASGVDDPVRLSTLAAYQIIDTPPEPEFDDIVQLARKLCDAPVALVSFVDLNRQWFKARSGLAACETSIEQSVCAHALAEGGLLVVPDLSLDPRTRENALVVGSPHLRFYAGAVLSTPEGVALGTLCVLDTVPRPHGLTSTQAEALLALARQTMVVMALRRAVMERAAALGVEREAWLQSVDYARTVQADWERLHREEGRLRLAQEAGGIGTFDIDVRTEECFVSAEFCRIFGLPVRAEHAIAAWQFLILPEDHAVISTTRTRREGSVQRDVEFRIRRGHDGALRWIFRRREFLTDDAGDITRMAGVVQDITERKLVETRNAALLKLGDDLRDAPSVREVVVLANRCLGEVLGVERAAFSLLDKGGETLSLEDDWTAPATASSAGRYPLATFGRTVSRLETATPLVVANIPAAIWMGADREWYEARGVKAMIAAPIMAQGRLNGIVFVQGAAPRTWSVSEVEFTLAVADRGYAALAKLRAEEQQHLLNAELSHRLKNTLSIVQAMAGQSLRGVADRAAVHAFNERLLALSRAHDVLLQQSWLSSQIGPVVDGALRLHGDGHHIETAGPNLTLGPKATLSLSLLLHELGTNAAKYGALSREAGRIRLEWRVDTAEREPTLVMRWQETGGPPATAPTRRGFGTRLISMGLAGAGGVALDYAESGLVAEFKAPLSSIAEI